MADATEKAEHDRIFKKFDANGDGKISAAELEEALKTLGSVTPDDVKRMMAEIDTDGDGNISYQEFTDFADESRKALTSNDCGLFALVEVLENGTLQGREYAVGSLLTLCQSNMSKYREPILSEGVIPSLLELTVKGTPKSRTEAKRFLCLLRDSRSPRSEFQLDALEKLVSDIISHINGYDQCGKAKKMLAEMVQVNM
ncbi:unnamed protein product [Arabidopsis arenosa]|uniref:EF-hand domain-containing protein n=1 Tax=Arabidopsis arenosa TaxID=38785 RepID=A0A8S2ALC6_ARAAE|nr:unnamed protein product [Arabidopsis arenosa]